MAVAEPGRPPDFKQGQDPQDWAQLIIVKDALAQLVWLDMNALRPDADPETLAPFNGAAFAPYAVRVLLHRDHDPRTYDPAWYRARGRLRFEVFRRADRRLCRLTVDQDKPARLGFRQDVEINGRRARVATFYPGKPEQSSLPPVRPRPDKLEELEASTAYWYENQVHGWSVRDIARRRPGAWRRYRDRHPTIVNRDTGSIPTRDELAEIEDYGQVTIRRLIKKADEILRLIDARVEPVERDSWGRTAKSLASWPRGG